MVKIDSLPEMQVGEAIESVIRKTAERVLQLVLQENGEDTGVDASSFSNDSNLARPNARSEVSIFLTDDAEIHRLNKMYRNVDMPTDVLAFAMREGVDGELNQDILGDVVISLPRAEQQARLYGHSFEEEISLLVSHGVLHLLGYEHEEKDEAEVMQRKQEEILRSLV